MAFRNLMFALIWAASFCGFSAAQLAFDIPMPGYSDFNAINTVVQNSVFNFVWKLNTTYQPTLTGEKLLDANNHISLWLTSFENAGYTKCLNPSVDSSNGGSWSFKVDISDDDIDNHNGKFVLRLKPTVGSTSSTYNPTYRECPSRGFLIKKQADVQGAAASSASAAAASRSSVAATASPTTSATSVSASASVTGSPTGAAASATSSPTQSSKDSGLSTGAKVGIAIGALAAVSFVALIAFILWRRSGKKSDQAPQSGQYGAVNNGDYYQNGQPGQYQQGVSPAGYSMQHNGPPMTQYKDAQPYYHGGPPPPGQAPAELGTFDEVRSELPGQELKSPDQETPTIPPQQHPQQPLH